MTTFGPGRAYPRRPVEALPLTGVSHHRGSADLTPAYPVTEDLRPFRVALARWCERDAAGAGIAGTAPVGAGVTSRRNA